MLTITKKQQNAFLPAEREKFITKSLAFLSENCLEWSLERSNDELHAFINSTIDFCEEHAIANKQNIQKMMFLRVQFDFDIPLSSAHLKVLPDAKLNENYRVKCFYKYFYLSNKNETKEDQLNKSVYDLSWMNES